MTMVTNTRLKSSPSRLSSDRSEAQRAQWRDLLFAGAPQTLRSRERKS
jgi:hypothetical protein